MIEVQARELMHPRAVRELPRGPHWQWSLKYDGHRGLVRKDADHVRIHSKSGIDRTGLFAGLVRDLRAIPGDWVLDTEICICNELGVPDFMALQSAVARRQPAPYVLFAFDLLVEGDQDWRDAPLLARHARLVELLAERPPSIGVVEQQAGAGAEMLAFCAANGLEGVVGKRAESRYRAGRSDDWIKIKPRGTHHPGGFDRPRYAARFGRPG